MPWSRRAQVVFLTRKRHRQPGAIEGPIAKHLDTDTGVRPFNILRKHIGHSALQVSESLEIQRREVIVDGLGAADLSDLAVGL